jgi:nucleotide-binding universal stress UspA family protein
MIKTILVPATGTEIDNATYPDAFAVARTFGANVDALHVAADPLEVAVNLSVDGGGAGGVLLERMIDDTKAEIDQHERDAHRIFVDACRGEGIQIAEPAKNVDGPSAQWYVEVGQEPRWIATYGMTADLIVAPRGKRGTDADARSTLEAALLETGRPLLVPGTSRRFAAGDERVAIAWKPTPQAARAVASALPFLTRAKAVTVLTVEEELARRDDADRLLRYLAWHGLKTAVKRLAPNTRSGPEALLAAAGDGFDLLVMGGYGHARLREWVFGGFTQHVLADAPIPVLIAH